MPKVTEATCSYTKACVQPGPVRRVPGTANHYCATHMRVVSLPAPTFQLSTPIRIAERSPLSMRRGLK